MKPDEDIFENAVDNTIEFFQLDLEQDEIEQFQNDLAEELGNADLARHLIRLVTTHRLTPKRRNALLQEFMAEQTYF